MDKFDTFLWKMYLCQTIELCKEFKQCQWIEYAPYTEFGQIVYLCNGYKLLVVYIDMNLRETFQFSQNITCIKYVGSSECGPLTTNYEGPLIDSINKNGCLLVNAGKCINLMMMDVRCTEYAMIYYRKSGYPLRDVSIIGNYIYLCRDILKRENMLNKRYEMLAYYPYQILSITHDIVVSRNSNVIMVQENTATAPLKWTYNSTSQVKFTFKPDGDNIFYDIEPDGNIISINQ